MRNSIMKILYVSPNDLSNEAGTTKKIQGQIKAFRNYGFIIESIFPSSGNIIYKGKIISKYSLIPYIGFFDMLNKLYKNSMRIALEESIESFYIRFSLFEWNFLKFTKIAKKHGRKVFLEIPSFPYDQEYVKKNLFKRSVILLDKLFRNEFHKYIEAIFTPSIISQSAIYNIPAFNFDNGIDPEEISPRLSHNISEKSLTIIGVAKLSNWHGYDRVINGLHLYKKNNGEWKVKLMIVGNGDELTRLKTLTTKLNLHEDVEFTGFRTGYELDKLYDAADLGLDAIGIHRKQLTKISSLKAREYCLKSIPFITIDGADEDFINFNFSIKVKSDDFAIDIFGVIDEFKKISKFDYIHEMRKYGEKHLTWNTKLKPIINIINNNC